VEAVATDQEIPHPRGKVPLFLHAVAASDLFMKPVPVTPNLGTTQPDFSHDSVRCWFRIMLIFPDYRNHFPRFLDMAYHLGLARSAAVAECLAQGTDGRGPIRR